jgi:ribose transport system ATP-binding protein
MYDDTVLSVTSASKRFASIIALRQADLTLAPGRIVGLVGHNGAGKSTLVNIVAGNFRADTGEIAIGGVPVGPHHSPRRAHQLGLRCVFQELSLCPNLDVAENTRIVHRAVRGLGWRRQAEALIRAALDDIFPGHGIDVRAKINDLPIAQRQMVEVARAFTVADDPLKLVILDEPTSALGDQTAKQLLDHIKRAAARGISFILITHRLDEIYAVADEIVVMKDGAVVAARPPADLPQRELVSLMGGGKHASGERSARSFDPNAPLLLNIEGDVPVTARAGEIIGFAGLDGHGQRDTLVAMATGKIPLAARTSFVAGDRQSDGVFPIWSIANNLSISSLGSLLRGPLLSRSAESELAETWRKRIGIRAETTEQLIATLSGGNQQKVLFARALAAPSPIVLLDDPMRGVDVGTKHEVYELIRNEADKGRTFVWYSTEVEELTNCDRVYVFREGRVVACLDRSEVSQHRIVEASFQASA